MASAKTAPKTALAVQRTATGIKRSAPAIDLQKFLNGFKLPGVDLESIVEGQRADIEAVALANKRANEGMKALAKRQAETMREAVVEWRAAVRELPAIDASELAARRTDLAKQAIQKALGNARELAEMMANSQNEAWLPVRGRLQDHPAKVKNSLPPN